MNELDQVVKTAAEDLAADGERAGEAISGHYDAVGAELTAASGRYRSTESEITTKARQVADEGAKSAAQDATTAETLGKAPVNQRIHDILGPKTGASDSPLYLKRQDDNFGGEFARGVRKSHLDANGDLVPANPDGQTTILQHVEGNRDKLAKGNSPFTSFAPEDGSGKVYGAEEIRLDHERLQADIASGKVSGVEVYTPRQIQDSIQAKIDETAGHAVPVPAGALKRDQIETLAKAQGLSRAKTRELVTRITALSNTRRDSEWLTKGVIPKAYLTGPFKTG